MGNLSNSSSDHSKDSHGHRQTGENGSTAGHYSPIHRELGAILKEDLFNILHHCSNNPDDYTGTR